MDWIVCWLLIHSSNDGLDNRQYIQVRGQVVKDSMAPASSIHRIDFHKAFEKMHVNMVFNPPVQRVNDNECSYDE